MLVACIVALTVVVCSLRLLASRKVEDIPVVVAAVAAWLAVNKPLEGPVLLRVSVDHGLTMADVFAAPPALLCLFVAVGAAIRRRRRRDVSPTTIGALGGRERSRADRSM